MKKIWLVFLIVGVISIIYAQGFFHEKNDYFLKISFVKGTTVSDSKPKDQSPPPWAPAHGYRAKYTYRYYPDACVYYDTNRRLYFYFSNEKWNFSASLPSFIKVDLGQSIVLEMDVDKPYIFHSEVIKRYPPKK
ncbi:MAG TPA: hypothetical protein PK894_02570 [Defluviitoga sp.]|nr:hypothetical protein [Defluviitoga sp.]HOP23884.1 hypothetical protein [Defluviitoga sp.]HPZ29277.1 hypothetical protein [Defluviitoga sp.]HQD62468.1 hypothetical protein [Defluviitoga sp.]